MIFIFINIYLKMHKVPFYLKIEKGNMQDSIRKKNIHISYINIQSSKCRNIIRIQMLNQ